eukprot:jgi/Ulvmu1/505/UM001_0513.1
MLSPLYPDAALLPKDSSGHVVPIEVECPLTAALGIEKANLMLATPEDIIAGLQRYQADKFASDHYTTTQLLTQMAAGRAGLGLLLCPQVILVLAIAVDRRAQGVHIFAFPSPTLCWLGRTDPSPYYVLVEVVLRARYIRRASTKFMVDQLMVMIQMIRSQKKARTLTCPTSQNLPHTQRGRGELKKGVVALDLPTVPAARKDMLLNHDC